MREVRQVYRLVRIPRVHPAGLNLSEGGFVIFVSADRPDFHTSFPLVLRYRQCVDAIVLGMGTDELNEGYLRRRKSKATTKR